MSRELMCWSTPGLTATYFHLFNAANQIYNTNLQAFETYNTANIGDYDIAATQMGTASGYYYADMPATAAGGVAGTYSAYLKNRAGGSPAESDSAIGTIPALEWDGSAVVTLYSRLAPTTAGRTLDVSAGGEAGIDWANVGTPGSTVNLSATTVNLVNTATTLTNKTGFSLASTGLDLVTAWTVNITGNLSGSVGSVTGNVGGNVTGSVGSVVGNVGGNVVGTVASVVGNVGGNVTGTIGGFTAPALAQFFTTDTTKVYADAVTGSVVKETATGSGSAAPTVAQIATGIWTDLLAGSDFSTVGSIGKLLKDDIDATISSRLATASYTAPPTASDNATATWAFALETGFSASRFVRIIGASVGGLVSGSPNSFVVRNLANTTDMIQGTSDDDGNRLTVSFAA